MRAADDLRPDTRDGGEGVVTCALLTPLENP